ncbi:MAG: translation initiation factor IF-2 [Candidatus Kapaibacteriota bacterium]
MAAGEKVKIIKIASEINIGRDAIVEFLKNKGFDIQNKPTATLTPEMVELVYEKFKREKLAAEKQREKLEKHHILKTPVSETKSGKEEDTQEIPVTEQEQQKPKEKSTLEPPLTAKTESVIDTKEKIAKGEEINKAEVTITSKEEKVSEKIEQIASPIEQVEVPEVKKEIVEEKTIERQDTAPTEKEIETKKIEEIDKEKETLKQVAETESKAQQKEIIERINVKEEIKEQVKKEEKTQEKASERKETGEKHKKKRHKVVEVVPGQAPKLKGLTIVGKIDLSKPKPQQKPNRESQQSQNRNKTGDRPSYQGNRDQQEQRNKQGGGHTESRRFDKDAPARPREERRTAAPPVVAPSSPITPYAKGKEKLIKVKNIDDEVGIKSPLKAKVKDKLKSKEDKFVKKHKKAIREQISEAEVEKAVRETIAEMDVSHSTQSRSKIKQKRKQEREEKAEIKQRESEERANVLELTEFVTTAELARQMDISPNQIIGKCLTLGLMVTINQRLDKDTILLIAEDFGYQVEFIDEQATQNIEEDEDDSEDKLVPRPPIVTIMGHVDHGKTSLLDQIRNSNVVAGEAGGITQHIGAYQVMTDSGKLITFLDTPGHAAFTAMRARGAQVTDIVVLVVAADDSVMPQTIEAISHAKAAGVPLIVAINKIDKPDANPDRIMQQLADYGVLVEDWGGKYQSVQISAKFGKNIDVLLEKILIEAELLDLKANPNRKAAGAVIEAVLKKGYGPVATVIIQKGSLKVGDPFVAGIAHGKVRRMLDEREKKVDIATPSTPVMIVGFDTLPEAGDTFIVVNSDIEARQIAQERARLKREQEFRQIRKISLDDISQRIQQGNVKELKLIIKGDVSGSVEALNDSLVKLSNDEVRVQIIHKGVGTILETDVILASASEAVIIGFNVSVDANARRLAEAEKVDIRLYNIIYDCINEINLAIEGLLTPEYTEETTAVVEVRQLFKISRFGTVAGCYVQNGKISKNDKVKVLRDGLVVYNGNISSLKREKDDVREVDAGYECGIMLSNFNDLQIGDIIESYKINEIKRKLR